MAFLAVIIICISIWAGMLVMVHSDIKKLEQRIQQITQTIKQK
ncbi:hypothetical protein [Candidatus Enterococcus willemsii]|nr:hypothetical protein [Enterococcus sp. CU12B]